MNPKLTGGRINTPGNLPLALTAGWQLYATNPPSLYFSLLYFQCLLVHVQFLSQIIECLMSKGLILTGTTTRQTYWQPCVTNPPLSIPLLYSQSLSLSFFSHNSGIIPFLAVIYYWCSKSTLLQFWRREDSCLVCSCHGSLAFRGKGAETEHQPTH